MRISFYIALASVISTAAGCLTGYKQFTPRYVVTSETHDNPVPDYRNLYYWAAHPYKQDPSDSLPPSVQTAYYKDSTVDVFFLHPSSHTDKKDTGWNADINDPVINAKTDYGPILYQGSAFNEYRLFAPRYRQAHVRAYRTTDTVAAAKAFELAYQDVKTAFRYYLAHFNKGRPIIIAGHSQGTTHALRLLKDFFEEGTLKNRLVAAYIPGIAIPANYFTSLPLCKSPQQTGCICGWRTFKTGYIPDWIKKEPVKSWVVNPITWTDAPATRAMNKGAILRKFNKKRLKVADAQIEQGVLWTHKPRFPFSFLIPLKNYHIGDINFYYFNIRENVHMRVGAFWKQ
jgi:hypothetical protein